MRDVCDCGDFSLQMAGWQAGMLAGLQAFWLGGLQVVRGESGVLGDAGQHAGAVFFAVVKREDKVRPLGLGADPVGAGGFPLDAPADSEKGGEDLPGFS